jgi:hypothetical protein
MLCLALLLWLSPASVQARRPRSVVSLGLVGFPATWTVERNDYSRMQFDGASAWGYSPLFDSRSSGSVFGLEAKLSRGVWFGRAFYSAGGASFDSLGSADMSMLGLDVGAAGLKGRIGGYLGYRRFELGFAKSLHEIGDQSISEIVAGFIMRSSPEKRGMFMDAQGDIGLIGLASEIGKDGNDANAPPGGDLLLETEVDLGYRWRGVPIAVSAGYALWSWTDRIDGFTPSGGQDEGVRAAKGLLHGLRLRVAYLVRR